jgi:uncharacterized protein (TIGR03663 family)
MIVRLVPILILLLLRFYDLGARPPHHDEAVNGWFVDGILNRGYYSYDPQNYHGPFFFYVLTLFEKVFGRNIEVLRSVTVLFGSAVSLTPLLFRKWLGSTGTWIACLMLAVSPALVFYSRYAIHETGFVLAIILFSYNWLSVREEGFKLRSMVGFGLSLGLMASMKENFVLFGACLGLAEGVIWLLDRKPPVTFNLRFWVGLSVGFGIAFVFVLIAFTGFFQDGEGLKKFIDAFSAWSETGTKGNGHEKPFYYWLKLFAEFEWPVLLGLLLTPLAFLKRIPKPLQLLSVLSFAHYLAYSIVSYKTPWCMLSFSWGLVFIASYWLGVWMEGKGKAFLIGGLVAGLIWNARDAYDVAWANPDQDGHPYIYGQTYHDLMEPLNEIIERGTLDPNLHNTLRIAVVSGFTWPLPYVLGEFKQVGYFGEQNAPAELDGDYILMDQTFEENLSPRVKGSYDRVMVRSRQWAAPMIVFKKRN